MIRTLFTVLLVGITTISANIISIADVNQEMLLTWMGGNSLGTVVEFPQGTTLPMQVSIKGDFFSTNQVEGTPYNIRIEKTVYVKVEKENFLFSGDLKEWKPMETFFTGSFGASLNIVEGKQQVHLVAELNSR